MQQPVRYYITKSGDEPTVRSVKVALGQAPVEDRVEGKGSTPATPPRPIETPFPDGVKRIVAKAISKRHPA